MAVLKNLKSAALRKAIRDKNISISKYGVISRNPSTHLASARVRRQNEAIMELKKRRPKFKNVS
jgi:hypothetical protein